MNFHNLDGLLCQLGRHQPSVRPLAETAHVSWVSCSGRDAVCGTSRFSIRRIATYHCLKTVIATYHCLKTAMQAKHRHASAPCSTRSFFACAAAIPLPFPPPRPAVCYRSVCVCVFARACMDACLSVCVFVCCMRASVRSYVCVAVLVSVFLSV